MDKSNLIEGALINFQPYPSVDMVDIAIRFAETETGYTVASITAGSDEQEWFSNRLKRSMWVQKMTGQAEEFTYGKAGVNQVFENYKYMIDMLDKEWKVMEQKIKSKAVSPEKFCQVIPPGYTYDVFGH